jgi:hypothetical protein
MAKKTEKLNERQLVIVAAIMGLSNAGQDGLFKGPHAQIKPEHVMDFYTSPRSSNSLEGAVICFGGGIFETEEMLAMFVDEAKSWQKNLKKMPVDKIKSTWSDYVPLFEAVGV